MIKSWHCLEPCEFIMFAPSRSSLGYAREVQSELVAAGIHRRYGVGAYVELRS